MSLAPPPTVSGSQVRLVPGGLGLRIEIEGERCLLDARLRRLFPLSEPNRFFSILDRDGKEGALLDSFDGMDDATRAALSGDLDRAYATARIERIDDLRQEAGMWRFDVSTSRGPVVFFVRNWRDSSVEIMSDRWMILSVDGVRFEIPDLKTLDDGSRKRMDLLL